MTGSFPAVTDVKAALTSWPRLGTFPATNGVIASMIALWLVTGACALVGAGLIACGYVGWVVPDSWYEALKFYSGATVAQFLAKRATFKVEKANGKTTTVVEGGGAA